MERDEQVTTMLLRLALPYYCKEFTASQAKLLIVDMVTDLDEYPIGQIAWACTAWRQKPDANYFPRSGQLIGLIKQAADRSIANARANRPAFRADHQIEGPRVKLKHWRDILADHAKKRASSP
jgi:hypothetical protein